MIAVKTSIQKKEATMTEREPDGSAPITNKERLAQQSREVSELRKVVKQETAWGMHDKVKEVPEGEDTWESYIAKRKSDGVIRDGDKFRDVPSGKFSSEEAYNEQNFSESPRQYYDRIGRYDAMEKGMGLVALAKEAALDRIGKDTEGESAIKEIAERKIREQISNEQEYSTEELEKHIQEAVEQLNARIDRFEERLRSVEESGKEPALKPEVTEVIEDPAPSKEEKLTLNGKPVTVAETFAAKNGKEIVEVIDEDGVSSYVPRESLTVEVVEAVGELSEPTSSENPTEELEMTLPEGFIEEQAEREKAAMDALEEVRKRDGLSDESVARYKADYKRMQQMEVAQKHLFVDHEHFTRFDQLLIDGEKFDLGTDTGFEQGQFVRVMRTSGALESDWVYMGRDAKGNALVRKIDPETKETIDKSYPLDKLTELNKEGAVDPNETVEKENKVRDRLKSWWADNKKYLNGDYFAEKWTNGLHRALEAEITDGMTDNEKQAQREKNRRHMIIGANAIGAVVALAGAVLIAKGMSDGLSAPGVENATDLVPDVDTSNLGVTPEEVASVIPGDVAPEQEAIVVPEILAPDLGFDVPSGGGGENLFTALGIDTSKWYANQETLLQKFPDSFYRMESGNVGIARPGMLPQEVQEYINTLR